MMAEKQPHGNRDSMRLSLFQGEECSGEKNFDSLVFHVFSYHIRLFHVEHFFGFIFFRRSIGGKIILRNLFHVKHFFVFGWYWGKGMDLFEGGQIVSRGTFFWFWDISWRLPGKIVWE